MHARDLLRLVALLLAGCQPTATLTFEPSEQVRSLGSEAESEEERQLWTDLQQQIATILHEKCGTPQRPRLLGSPETDPKQLALGASIYARRCQSCHGVSGDGQGPVAQYLLPRPRDYRRGIFKFTTTRYGAKPRRADLMRTVRRGVTGTSMPSFDELSQTEIAAVVDYVLVLTHRGELEGELALLADEDEEIDEEYLDELIGNLLQPWRDARHHIVKAATPMPDMTAATVRQGHKLFLKQACNKCHGKDGRGGSLGNVDVGTDAWGQRAAAADLTSGMFRGGDRPIDLYRRISAGINGTPMPSFATTFVEDPVAIWYLVHFIQDTGQLRRRNLPPHSLEQIQAIEAEIEAERAQTSAGDSAIDLVAH